MRLWFLLYAFTCEHNLMEKIEENRKKGAIMTQNLWVHDFNWNNFCQECFLTKRDICLEKIKIFRLNSRLLCTIQIETLDYTVSFESRSRRFSKNFRFWNCGLHHARVGVRKRLFYFIETIKIVFSIIGFSLGWYIKVMFRHSFISEPFACYCHTGRL